MDDKSNKKRLLIISTVGLIYDGITSVITSYLDAMDRSNYEIYVVATIKAEDHFIAKVKSLGCNVVYMPSRKKQPLLYFIKLLKFIYFNKINILHVHGNSSTMFIEMLAGFLGRCKKRIAHCHNTKCLSKKVERILRPLFYMFYTDALACGKDAGLWLYGDRNFTILPNGRDVPKYAFDKNVRKELRYHYMLLENQIAIGHVGGFLEQKNHEFLLSVFKEIQKIAPNAVFFSVGDGPLFEQIRDQAKLNNLNVIFTGCINNVNDYLQLMDGMLLPSKFEGLPLVTIEWQINGLPFVMSDTITKECKIMTNALSLSLKTSPKTWAITILELIKNNNRNNSSRLAVTKFQNSSFDIKCGAIKLKQIYDK